VAFTFSLYFFGPFSHIQQTPRINYIVPEDFLVRFSELGISLFEIAQSLFALERTLILGAMALNKKKREEQRVN